MSTTVDDPVGHALGKLGKYTQQYKIFIDTCSLVHPAAEKFWHNIVPILRSTGSQVIIAKRVIDELERLPHQKGKSEQVKSNARLALNRLGSLQRDNLIVIRGETSDNFADNVFQVVFTKFRMQHKLLLITQDRGLSSDILALNNSQSVNGKAVRVERINQYGFLSQSAGASESGNAGPSQGVVKEATVAFIDRFPTGKQVTTVSEDVLPVSSIPEVGDSVVVKSKDATGELELVGAVATGGEGTIYTTNSPYYVAKIYKKEKINRRRYEKIKLMLSKRIEHSGVCYPTACLYNQKDEFVGYLMPRAQGAELQKSLFIKPLLLKKFPDWKKRDAVQLCVTILEKIKYLHDRNIIMGDINPANILVKTPADVYFVDTDSYQVGDFPCPVGTINFTAPEIQRKKFGEFLRTRENEHFAVATLLFMIMLPGKPPYSQQGGENPIENVMKMDFSYRLKALSNHKTPEGPWRYIWSHLTFRIKEAFYHTFRAEGDFSKPEARLSTDKWLEEFREYLRLLDNGTLREQDTDSEELFPMRFKIPRNIPSIICQLCEQKVLESKSKGGICQPCLDESEYYPCSKCGTEIKYTNYDKHIGSGKRNELCRDCYDFQSNVYETRYCVECSSAYDITNGMQQSCSDRGHNLPKRCKPCRQKRKSQTSTSNTSNTGMFSFLFRL